MVELRARRRRASSRSVDDMQVKTRSDGTHIAEASTYSQSTEERSTQQNTQTRKQGRLDTIVTWQSLGLLFLVVALTGFSLNVAVEFTRYDMDDFGTILMISFALLFVILAVPLTYFIVGWWRYGRESQHVSNWSFFQPLRGGIHFVILQASAWTIYSLVLILIVWVAFSGAKKIASGVLATIGTAGVLAQLLILISLQFFVAASNDASHVHEDVDVGTDKALTQSTIKEILKRQRQHLSSIPEPNSAPVSGKQRKASLDVLKEAGIQAQRIKQEGDAPQLTVRPFSKAVDAVPIALSLVSAVLAIAVESLDLSTGATVSIRSVAVCGLLIAVPMTHVLVATKHSKQLRYTGLSDYKLFQPLTGGTRFVSLQALGWAVWTMALLVALFSIYAKANDLHVTGMFTVSSIGGVLSQMFVLLSLRYFDSSISKRVGHANAPKLTRSITKQLRQDAHLSDIDAEATAIALLNASASKHTATAVGRYSFSQLRTALTALSDQHELIERLKDVRALCVVTAFFLSPMFSFLLIMSPFGLAYTLVKNGVIMPYALIPSIVLVSLYGLQFRHSAQKTGTGMWPAFRYNDVMWSDFARYFRARVIGDGHLSKKEQYIFCFSPHGIYPMSTVWSTRCPEWYANYDIEVNVAGASVMFYVPIIRELVLWSGGIDVSRASVVGALKQGKNILLIPGGQREMRHSKSSKQCVKLVNKHKGFVKLAIERGCALVPIYSFGEHELIDNISAPGLQAITTRWIGYMFPMWPFGRWYSPLPNPVQLTFVVGEPIYVEQNEKPTQEQIDKVHGQYYTELKELFYKYRGEAGYPDLELVLLDK